MILCSIIIFIRATPTSIRLTLKSDTIKYHRHFRNHTVSYYQQRRRPKKNAIYDSPSEASYNYHMVWLSSSAVRSKAIAEIALLPSLLRLNNRSKTHDECEINTFIIWLTVYHLRRRRHSPHAFSTCHADELAPIYCRRWKYEIYGWSEAIEIIVWSYDRTAEKGIFHEKRFDE